MNTQTVNPPTDAAVLRNPFPGLRPFEFEESHLFFGRDGQSERLIAKLAATRFLAVVGTSGSGKSSLVRAGLLPALYSGFMPGAGSAWRVAVMRPGNDPLGNLARALNHPDVFGSDDEANRALQVAITEATLRRGSLGLIEAAREQSLPPNENLLVVADQFEELFRVEQGAAQTELKNDRAAFVKLLLAATAKPQSKDASREVNIYVVLTMRSDYLGDCAQFWDLPEAINEGQYLIPRLTREQIREAITGPIFVGGAEATPRLINRLLNDVGDNPDQLPILQHALMRTWNHWIADCGLRIADSSATSPQQKRKATTAEQSAIRNPQSAIEASAIRNPIDLEHYEAIGGMMNALSIHADEAFHQLPDPRHRVVAERVFKALTEKGPDNREIRRPLMLGALCLIADASEAEVKKVIETFRAPGRSFLMPPAGTELKAESLIDISHESLMRNWLHLKDWVEEEADSASKYRRLAETARLYLKDRAGLWRDPDLQLALDWQSVARPNKHWASRYDAGYDAALAFLEKSEAQRTADLAAAELQQRKEAEQAKRELAAAQALAAEKELRIEAERKQAEIERQQAAERERQQQEQLALSQRALEQSEALAAEQAKRAETEKLRAEEQAKLAEAEKLRAEEQAKLAEAQKLHAEERAQAASKIQRRAWAAGLLALVALLAAWLAFRSYRSAEAQRVTAEEQRQRAQTSENIAIREKAKADIARDDAEKAAKEAEEQKKKAEAKQLEAEAAKLAEELQRRIVALQNLKLTDSLTQSASLLYVSRGLLSQAAFDQQNYPRAEDFLLASFQPGTSKEKDLRSFDWFYRWRQLHDEKATLKGHGASVWSVAFAPDGRTVASGSADRTVKLWDVASGQERATLKGHGASVLSVAFAPDGRTLASGGGGWAGSDGKQIFPLLLWLGATDAEVARDCLRCGQKQE